ncbi:hypothetical protein CFC21_112089 [Triticum aestivum]|uniref:UDP-glycosyltransferases domain-containing protein n=2 Tax=Triticum aestivum TaxID=4565 RepID=A0A3B6TN64_WHEAT|nr:hypothetical protein CFC21_112089 [Triticum aestivum]
MVPPSQSHMCSSCLTRRKATCYRSLTWWCCSPDGGSRSPSSSRQATSGSSPHCRRPWPPLCCRSRPRLCSRPGAARTPRTSRRTSSGRSWRPWWASRRRCSPGARPSPVPSRLLSPICSWAGRFRWPTSSACRTWPSRPPASTTSHSLASFGAACRRGTTATARGWSPSRSCPARLASRGAACRGCSGCMWSVESSCFVVNSFAALEAGCFRDALAAKRVFMVGPLSEAAGVRGGGSEPAEVCAWLDGFYDGSVVYICFGSQEALSPAQAACVAEALRLSPTAAFVWVARGSTVVPEGFEAATASRGRVVRGWAPQLDILRHRAVGWTLTHCGSNSVMESVAAGVALLTWPMAADQFTKAWLLAEAGAAVPVAEGADAVPDAEKMASAISKAVASEEGESTRKRAVELGRNVAAAVTAGGTSCSDLQELVRALGNVDGLAT